MGIVAGGNCVSGQVWEPTATYGVVEPGAVRGHRDGGSVSRGTLGQPHPLGGSCQFDLFGSDWAFLDP